MKPGVYLRLATGTMLVAGLLLAAAAAWPHAKAFAAQVLLQQAWQASDHGREHITPWPSADMAPIAALSFPASGKEWIVLDNDSGQALAFGPGWNPASTPPGQRGLVVISAHRDTQFRLLRNLKPGANITLASRGHQRFYHVVDTRIVDSRGTRIAVARGPDALLLVTCYPFDAITAGGPLRYVVRAEPVGGMSVASDNVQASLDAGHSP